MIKTKPRLIEGMIFTDDRGTLRVVNEFNFEKVKRFYQVENWSLNTIRAFHGHLKEAKYVYVTSGAMLVNLVKLTNKYKPSTKAAVERFVLTSGKPSVLYIPPGYANGFKALVPNSSVMFWSTSTLEQSKGDDYRFPSDYWGKEIWETENR